MVIDIYGRGEGFERAAHRISNSLCSQNWKIPMLRSTESDDLINNTRYRCLTHRMTRIFCAIYGKGKYGPWMYGTHGCQQHYVRI